MPRTRVLTAGLVLVAAAGLAACSGGEKTETAETLAIQEQLEQVDGVVEADVRFFDEDDDDNDFLALDLDLGDGSRAGHLPPVAHAARAAVEDSEYADVDVLATVTWTDGELEREMSSHGAVRMLSALSNEAVAMLVLERHGFERISLSVSDNAYAAQYARDIRVDVPVGTPGRAFVRLYDVLRTQLPDQAQETRFAISYHDWESDVPEARRLRVIAGAAPELVGRADAVLRSPLPPGWDGGSDLGVSVDGFGESVDEQYISVRMTLEPAALRGLDEDGLADHAGDAVVMEPGHHLAATMAAPVGGAFYDLAVGNDAGYAEVASFFSGDCTQAWEDETGRSRAVWETWVGAGGTPQEGATATECPDA